MQVIRFLLFLLLASASLWMQQQAQAQIALFDSLRNERARTLVMSSDSLGGLKVTFNAAGALDAASITRREFTKGPIAASIRWVLNMETGQLRLYYDGEVLFEKKMNEINNGKALLSDGSFCNVTRFFLDGGEILEVYSKKESGEKRPVCLIYYSPDADQALFCFGRVYVSLL
ncbi:MAG: hypothetical protein KatS3mg033_1140 [Thermonema sp.]|uniref:hypothetical protein n=1 Tax=Thermonema sp. TaxID=2231181 RepID=UPI0021DD2A4E|nr:hypothetical protein [Thermonema sp.]GIV39340.1 MAG: hypothetical protein KatS3mg033_1140 [Thermonema sp.]